MSEPIIKRIIKFRAKMLTDGKKWIFYQDNQYLPSFLRRVMTLHGVSHPKYLERDGKHIELEELLEMTTGLHDKNGKEIWEGDVVQYPRLPNYGKQEIVYDSAAFTGFMRVGPRIKLGQGEPVEVIGNIYENPELLS